MSELGKELIAALQETVTTKDTGVIVRPLSKKDLVPNENDDTSTIDATQE